MKRIAIQGLIGSFHDIAAHLYFEGEQIQLICCATFEEVFAQIKQDPTVIGMTAIENTIAGSLLHNYELLRESGTTIVGEHKLHPQLKNVEAEDTAGAAKMISEECREHWAAICSSDAAKLYGMKILEDHIEDNKHNFTRFLVVSNPNKADMLRPLTEANKASIVFSLPHEEGSLSHVLAILSFYKINLTKIQSLPIIGREWEYLFYVDLMYDDLTRYRQSIDAIIPLTKDFKILGEYKDGRQTN